MLRGIERIDALFDNTHRKRRVLVSPEGVPLEIQVAGAMERFGTFILDMLLMGLIILLASISFGMVLDRAFNAGFKIISTMILFIIFVVRNCYFLHFELAWQGRTPGKKACSLRVINRKGGELTPSAVIARNLTREVEFFLPITLLFTLGHDGTVWRQLITLGWIMIIAILPLLNSGRLRAGDLIGGTQVIAMPKRRLRTDLSAESKLEASNLYKFSHQQLSLYGTFELQVLEEILRRPSNSDTNKLLEGICRKICQKIGWEEAVPPQDIRRFLTDFYSAERGELERGQLFGKVKKDKQDGDRLGGDSSGGKKS